MDGNFEGARDLRELQFGFAGIESLGTMTRQLDPKALLNDLSGMMFEGGRVQTDIRWTDPVDTSNDYLNRAVEVMGRHGFETSPRVLAEVVNSDFGRSMVPTVRGGGAALFGPDDYPEAGGFSGDPRVATPVGAVVVAVVVAAIILGWPRKAH